MTEKFDGCKNDPQKSFTGKIGEHVPSGFSMSTVTYKDINSTNDVCNSKDCMKMQFFCECLKKHANKIIDFKKKKK